MDTVESVLRIEPARVEEPTEAIADVVAEVSAASATLGLKPAQRRHGAVIAGVGHTQGQAIASLPSRHPGRAISSALS